jgi:glycosyltransferase involved in cell wall biosynthesis
MVVEKDFDSAHVGVKRVIDYYESVFSSRGFEVTFATAKKRGLVSLDSLAKIDGEKEPSVSPITSKGKSSGIHISSANLRPKKSLAKWSNNFVKATDYDISIITAPWLVKEFSAVVLDQHFTFGIVYDVVPNLVSLGILNFGIWIDIAEFATAHSMGIEYFGTNCSKTLAISASTKSDIVSLFQKIDPDSIEIIIPFKGRSADAQTNWIPRQTLNLIVVNGLDHRKNFKNACKAIEHASKQVTIDVTFVGRERIAAQELNEIFGTLAKSGVKVTWFREIDDSKLSELYSSMDYLLFPSIYEGLGLPILEAQDHGIPAISSNSSSCVEINLNPQLTFDPYDWESLSNLLVSLAKQDLLCSRGSELQCMQNEIIQANSLIIEHLFNENKTTG